MPNPEIVRNPNAQSKRSLRHHEQRALNHLEPNDTALVVNDVYAGAQAATSEGAATYDEPFYVMGFERLCLFIAATQGTATAVSMKFQVAWFRNAPDSQWYDLCTDPDADGGFDPYELGVAIAADGNFAVEIPLTGVWMRAKAWMPGGSAASRVSVRGARLMNAS